MGAKILNVGCMLAGLPGRFVLGCIRLYQLLLSPWVGSCCRYRPSCSCYAYQAICRYGVMRGGVLSAKRILRCHPWHAGGEDPVP